MWEFLVFFLQLICEFEVVVKKEKDLPKNGKEMGSLFPQNCRDWGRQL